MRRLLVLASLLPLALGGCLAKTALNVATAPVRVAGKAADLATTSQAEADQNRGREIRRREERLGQLERQYEKQNKLCVKGDEGACSAARVTYNQIQVLLPSVPVEPRD
jgi:hypothetical protein